MTRKETRQNGEASRAAPGAKDRGLLPAEAARVRELIAGRHSKTALQLAKDLHKRCAAADSETLLVEAYKARIDDLLKLGMTVEAKSLLAIVQERFPASLARLAEVGREICAQDGRLGEVVGPLCDPNLPAEDRDRIEALIRQQIHDLPALASVSSLPQEHPLRVAASALAEAFNAVTSGPVDDGILAFTEVSRRSPLASWKALVRAIACYYRHEDAECNKWLRTIVEDSVPARLVPAAAALRGLIPDSKFTAAETKLIGAVGDPSAVLRSAVAKLEKAFHAKKLEPVLDAVRKVAAASERCDPMLRERLRQHIAVRSIMHHFPLPSVHTALGALPRQDAYYYRLLARALETQQYVEGCAEASIVWEDFRREAIKENWFAAGSLEDGVLALHTAELIEKVPEDLVEEMKDRQPAYRKATKWKDWQGLPSPAVLYRRACEADPHPETFQAWLKWAKKQAQWQEADAVAERWRKARPADIQPLLHLMESSEKRSAFKKSLKYLEEAETLDRVNPEVRRAKLRLLLSAVLRHLSQRKPHLARGGIEQLEAIPEVRPGEFAALAAALRWCSAAVDGDKPAQQEREAELNNSVGWAAAHLLIAALLHAAKLSGMAGPSLKVSETPALELLTGAVKVCLLGEWAGLRIPLPPPWNDRLIAALHLPSSPLDAAQMLVLGESAIDCLAFELAYAVSSVGLAGGKANARFLFLRARCLPAFAALRRNGCLTAALELARRERNTELAGKILDLLSGNRPNGDPRHKYGWRMSYDPRIASRPVSPELLSKIIEEEKTLEQFPIFESYHKPKYAPEPDYSVCGCPECRARRGETADDGEEWDDDDEDDFDDDEDDFALPPSLDEMAGLLDEILRSLPPAVAQSAAQKLKKAMTAGEDPFTAISRIIGKETVRPERAAKPQKAERKPPEQGSLF